MKDDVKEVVRSVLTDYIETNHSGRHPNVLLCLTPHTALEDSSERKTWWRSWRSAIFM